MNRTQAVQRTEIPGLPVRRGKVRDVYDLGDRVLLVATDRISAFDVVLPTAIPGKGQLLTRMSQFWFHQLAGVTPHHLLEVIEGRAPAGLEGYLDQLRGRTCVCRKAEVVPIECVVRGYIAGSGWKEYESSGSVCGIRLPAGLRQCDRLAEPIFTPATKAEEGHDENISFDDACRRAGSELMHLVRQRSIDLYRRAHDYAAQRGIIIADTKFEFGMCDGEVILVDEALTPDSSRFWPADAYEPGRDQDSFDKQYVRNYLLGLVRAGKWNKQPPGPELPADVVSNTAAKYREGYERLVGEERR